MPNYRTLKDLREEALELGDLELDAFITEAGVNAQVNRSIESLHDRVLEQARQFGRTFSIIPTVPNQDTIDLPADLYQLLGVDWFYSDRWRPMRPLDFGRRTDAQKASWGLYSEPRYQEISEAKLQFFPPPSSVFDVRIWWIPNAPLLVNDTDELKFPNGWGRWVVYDVVQFYKIKGEDDISEIVAAKAELTERLIRAAKKRERTGLRIQDVRGFRGHLAGYRDQWGWWP